MFAQCHNFSDDLSHLTKAPYNECHQAPDHMRNTKKSVAALPGMLFGPWSPSSANVMRVHGFQPFFTFIVRILSRILDVCPSLFITFRENTTC